MKQLLSVSILMLLMACREKKEEPKPFLTGLENKPIPAFNILLDDSTTYVNTTKLVTDKKIILFYYSPTCPYCRAQMRDMVENIDMFKDNRIYAITTADFDSMESFRRYFNLEKYPNVTMGIDTGNMIAKSFNVPGVPFTAFYDRKQNLKAAFLGIMSHKTLVKAISLY